MPRSVLLPIFPLPPYLPLPFRARAEQLGLQARGQNPGSPSVGPPTAALIQAALNYRQLSVTRLFPLQSCRFLGVSILLILLNKV